MFFYLIAFPRFLPAQALSPYQVSSLCLRKFQSWSDSHGERPEASGLTMDEILHLAWVVLPSFFLFQAFRERGVQLTKIFAFKLGEASGHPILPRKMGFT